MKKRLIFDLDFFRMNHKAFRAILLKIAIKNGRFSLYVLVSEL